MQIVSGLCALQYCILHKFPLHISFASYYAILPYRCPMKSYYTTLLVLLTHLLVDTVALASVGLGRSKIVRSAVKLTFTMFSLTSGFSFLAAFFSFASPVLVVFVVSVPLTLPASAPSPSAAWGKEMSQCYATCTV